MVEENTLIEDFDYHLPPELVAQEPLTRRDASRLLVLQRQTGEVVHAHFRDLANWLDPDDLLVVNNTRVFPARLHGFKASGGRVELLLHHLPQPGENGAGGLEARATHRGRLRPGLRLHFGADLQAEIISLPEPGVAEVRFWAAEEVLPKVLEHGEVPLPPYIQRAAAEPDRANYQTMFARQTGAVACPTAGLHFTPEVLQELAGKGIKTVSITLHVGPGTFLPVRHADYTRHQMLPEYFELSEAAAARLNEAKRQGQKIVAVGSTSTRVLEHCAKPDGFAAQQGWCGLFIYPGYQFQAVDRLLTNFHLPKSTLLLLVSAFAGRDLILRAYEEAVKEKYRFFSYGDCMLIL
ncbi:MAG: tRNA preQ1(34) S-adenosylmethionine ribosyltransferase-isomerase QueA [Deltaproteobacteria bacterium]|nr:tRNA preQ1(34) S-adenosylmethionine ribosyltransferase-isomerase QueA [Deltaproteobacteria bacterium]